VDTLREWGWSPADADLNADLQNTVVFTTINEGVAQSLMTAAEWERTPLVGVHGLTGGGKIRLRAPEDDE
jgi:hypothetical protein